MVTPELNLPKKPAKKDDPYEWKLQTYAHLFWALPRSHDEAKWNRDIVVIENTQANALLMPDTGSAARAFSASIPALTNTKAIKKGEEIVLKWPKPKTAAKAKAKPATWIEAAQKAAKKQKQA